MIVGWKRANDGFVKSRCGHWQIAPLYCGCTRPQSYELRRDGSVVASFCTTQREAFAEDLVSARPAQLV